MNMKDEVMKPVSYKGWIDPNTNQATLIDRYAQQRAMPPADTDLGGIIHSCRVF